MIISHTHRFVFVKTRKTAGTSLEVLLGRIAGDDAVVTPIWPEVPGHVPRNFMRVDNPLRSAVLRARQRQLSGDARDHPAYFNHIPARGIRKRLGRRRWNGYLTFTFERNPWDKVVSEYFWRQGNGKADGEFRDFVLRGDFTSDFDMYSLDGETVGVDFVGRYEHLDDDLRTVLERLGIADRETALTREKGNFRPSDARVDTLFDDEMSRRVESVFAREIRAFGYTRSPLLAAQPPSEPAAGDR
ncbi:MAG TPA: sulfotransferase family 2 domain-containing protein [Acidimicrobiia bacterium]|nr:sulfotransferase family 2 domain-containing protein [Acidimicrobiia bacterium]